MQCYVTQDPEITFSKLRCRRFHEHKSYKVTHKIKENIFTFDFSNNEKLEIVKNIWFNNYDSINKISFIFVPKYNLPQKNLSDVFDLTEWIETDNRVILNENMSLKEILEIPNTLLIDTVSVDILKYLNSYNYKNNNTEYLNFPIRNTSIFSLYINSSKYNLVIHLQKKNNVPIDLIVKYYGMTESEAEGLFRHNTIEYLITRHVEINYNVNSSEKIKLNFINTLMRTIIVKSPKKLSSLKIGEHNFIDSRENPEHIYKSNDYYFYILDQSDEVGAFNDIQPVSSYVFSENDLIEVTHDDENEVPITITYLIYDYQTSCKERIFFFTYSKMLNQQKIKLINNEISKNLETKNLLTSESFYNLGDNIELKQSHFNMNYDNNLETVRYSDYKRMYYDKYPEDDPINNVVPAEENIPVPVIEPVIPPANAPVIPVYRNNRNNTERFLNLYYKYINIFINDVERVHSKNKLLENDTVCEVTLDPIKIGDFYYACPQCNGKFESKTYKTWIEDSTKSGKCPKCQIKIDEIPQLYCNNTFPNKKTFIFYSSIILSAVGIFKLKQLIYK